MLYNWTTRTRTSHSLYHWENSSPCFFSVDFWKCVHYWLHRIQGEDFAKRWTFPECFPFSNAVNHRQSERLPYIILLQGMKWTVNPVYVGLYGYMYTFYLIKYSYIFIYLGAVISNNIAILKIALLKVGQSRYTFIFGSWIFMNAPCTI